MTHIFQHIRMGVVACFILAVLFLILPVQAFTADSLNITVDKNGDASAVFRFTLEGVIENAIPESVLQEQLVKGLATSSDPPQVVSFDKSQASLILKNFAVTNDVATGTEYQTAPMDFKKAQLALQNSAVSTVISADFSPATITVTFPDGYSRTLGDSSALPSLTHTVVDPTKAAAVPTVNASALGAIKVSTSPATVHVYIDSVYAGESPDTFTGISPGQHEVMLEADGYVTATKTVTVRAGETATIFESLTFAETPTKKAGVTGTGIWAFAGVVAVCGVIALRRK
ncbi:MAG: PEGA domain-containing protein [Methanoregula sp.]|nr:PEGA domain-containing protein [Methanoregula sp.]